MKKSVMILILFSFLLCGCSVSEERNWLAGQKALSEENYDAAAAAFEKAGSYQDAEQLLLYARACQTLENGDYEEAYSAFRSMGDFKDCRLMTVYCQAREQEAVASTAFSTDSTYLAVSSVSGAISGYSSLPLFRDCDMRATKLRDSLYAQSSEWLGLGRYEDAASGFSALGDWQDSTLLQKYCRAAALEEQAFYLEASELFSEIPEVLDAGSRAEAARAKAYDLAAQMKERGEYEAAASAFAALDNYRDAKAQRDSSLVLLVRTLLQSGSYAEALKQFSVLSDLSVFPEVQPADVRGHETFLTSFLNVWMNAHARVMTGFFSCNLLQPYLIPGDELDLQIRSELTDEGLPQNYGYIFHGAEVSELYSLDDGFTAGKVSASSSWIGPDGRTATEETLWVLLDSRAGNTVAAGVLSA